MGETQLYFWKIMTLFKLIKLKFRKTNFTINSIINIEDQII